MRTRRANRALSAAIVAIGAIVAATGAGPIGILSKDRPEPTQVVPLPMIPPEYRGPISEVIRESSFHHQGEAETSPAIPSSI